MIMERLLSNIDTLKEITSRITFFSFIFFLLSLFLACSKPSSTEPEPQRTQIEVTEDITEDTVWESWKDYGV